MSGGGSVGNIITGATDVTEIGNISDQFKVIQYGQTSTDANQTVSTSGNTAAFDTNGYAMISVSYNVTAISGSGAYIQFHKQTSDDGTNWTTYADTPRMTAVGGTRYQGFRHAGRYYRFTWDVAGTTPSVTFNIVTTLKAFSPLRKTIRFFYSDIDLSTDSAVSSTFSADDCPNVGLSFSRASDGGNNANVRVQVSMDGTNWFDSTANLAANPGAKNTADFADNAYRFYRLIVTGNTNAGTRTLDIIWSGT